MTRQEFIAKFRHEIDGWVLDACLERRPSGLELSKFLREMRAKIEVKLGDMFDAVIADPPKPLPASNGQHKPTTPATR